MRQYHVIPKTGTPASGPLTAAQVVALYEQATSTGQMLIWWKEQKGWDKIGDHIDDIRIEASEARQNSSPKPEPAAFIPASVPAASNGVPAGQVRVTRDGAELGAFHEPDIPALLRAKVLQPTDSYLSAGMSKPAPLSELLLALLLKPGAHQAAPSAGAAVSVGAPATAQPQRQDSRPSQASTPRGRCCPRCHSEDIRTFEMVYKSGSSSADTIGITLSGDIGQARTRSRTDLAGEVAPPDMSGPGCFSTIMAVALGLIIGMSVNPLGPGALIGAIGGLVIRFGIHFAGASDRDAQYAQWKKSWMCMKCGNKFQG